MRGALARRHTAGTLPRRSTQRQAQKAIRVRKDLQGQPAPKGRKVLQVPQERKEPPGKMERKDYRALKETQEAKVLPA